MLPHSLSDPVLIKPHLLEFLQSWNERKGACPFPASPSIDQLYGILITISEDDPKANSKMPKQEREKRQKKLEFQLKRRSSVLLANIKEESAVKDGLQRSFSCTELRQPANREITNRKRVSFTINVPNVDSIEQIKVNDDEFGQKKEARPILVRRSATFSGTDKLSHMDFDSFAAWKRGSRMSKDVEKCARAKPKRKVSVVVKKHTEAERREEMKNDDWWIVRLFRHGFDSCLSRRRVTPSPPPSLNFDKDSIKITIDQY